MNAKKVAKEWITFLLSAILGIALVPGVIFILATKYGSVPDGFSIGSAYAELLFKEKGILIFPIGAYLFVLLIRSIIWAVKSASEKESQS